MKDTKENREKAIKNFNKFYDEDDIFHEYLSFSQYIQNVFISQKGWVIDTGNFKTANRELIELIERKINKHPILFNLFFRVV